jgi:predicted NAD/FAD-dependent oxidoreductase
MGETGHPYDPLVEQLAVQIHACDCREARRQGSSPMPWAALSASSRGLHLHLARFILKHAPGWSVQNMLGEDLSTPERRTDV